MAINYNPFHSAYTHGTKASLLERLKFTYLAFAGDLYSDNEDDEVRVGIFDYLTLFWFYDCYICFMLTLEILFNKDPNGEYEFPLFARLMITIGLLLIIPVVADLIIRAVFALSATILFSPVVLIIHLVLPTYDRPSQDHHLGRRLSEVPHNVPENQALEQPTHFNGMGVYAAAPQPKLEEEPEQVLGVSLN